MWMTRQQQPVVGTLSGVGHASDQTITAPSGVGVHCEIRCERCDQWARSVAWARRCQHAWDAPSLMMGIGIVGLYLSSAIFGGTDTMHEVAAFDVFTALFDPAGDLIWGKIWDIGFDYGAAVIDHDSRGTYMSMVSSISHRSTPRQRDSL